MALGFNPVSASPISSIPIYYPLTGLVGTTTLRSVTAAAGQNYTLTGFRATTTLRSVTAGAGNNISLTGIRATASVADHQCARYWSLVDTIKC